MKLKPYYIDIVKTSIIQCINELECLKSIDIPYGLDLKERLDCDINEEDINFIKYCIFESINEESSHQFETEYLWGLQDLLYKLI